MQECTQCLYRLLQLLLGGQQQQLGTGRGLASGSGKVGGMVGHHKHHSGPECAEAPQIGDGSQHPGHVHSGGGIDQNSQQVRLLH